MPVNLKKCTWTITIFLPVNYPKVPVKMSKKVPVNALPCPWTFSKSAREREKVHVKHVEKMTFTYTFNVHGKKKTLYISCIYHCTTSLGDRKNYPPNSLPKICHISFEKNGDAPGPLGDFIESLLTERPFLSFLFSLFYFFFLCLSFFLLEFFQWLATSQNLPGVQARRRFFIFYFYF